MSCGFLKGPTLITEEIHGFQTPGEYRRFVKHLEGQVCAGKMREMQPDPTYGKGGIYGGRWFIVIGTEETWRLVPPGFPFKGL